MAGSLDNASKTTEATTTMVYSLSILKTTKAEEGHFRLPTSDFGLRTSDFGLPTSDFRLPTSDFRLPTSDFRLPTSDFRLPTSDFRLQASGFRLQYLLLTSLRVYFLKAGCFEIVPDINGKTTSLLCHCVPPQRKL